MSLKHKFHMAQEIANCPDVDNSEFLNKIVEKIEK